MAELKNKYPAVCRDGQMSYGGNQLWSENKNMRLCGCGVIACADVLLYLGCYHPEYQLERYASRLPVNIGEYEKLTRSISPRYLPLIPRFGINGIALAAGLNGIFRSCGSPLRASWGIKITRLKDTVADMLERDIPVILSVGPNFPLFWRKEQVSLYTCTETGRYARSTGARAHYVVVTGINGGWLQISSWGRKYCISTAEYLAYARKHSGPLLSSIVTIK